MKTAPRQPNPFYSCSPGGRVLVRICLVLLTAALLWGCAAKGFIRHDRFINNRYGFTLRIPEGWGAQHCLSDPLRQVLKEARFPMLHPLLVLSNPAADCCLQVAAGRSLYAYNLYTSYLFGSAPPESSRDYNPGINRSAQFAVTATREGGATDPVSVRVQWENHFQAFADKAGQSDRIRAYTRYTQKFGSHPGFHEQWSVRLEDGLHAVRKKTLFFRCKEDDTCFAAFTLICPLDRTEQNTAQLEKIIASFERFFPFERPY